MLEDSVVQEPIRQSLTLIFMGLLIGGLLMALTWRKGTFQVNFSFLPKIRGIEVIKGFMAFLLAEILIVPAMAVVSVYLGTGRQLSTYSLSATMKGWLNMMIILGGFLSVWIVYWQLSKETRSQLWRQNSLPWYEHLLAGVTAWFVTYPLVIAFSQLISLIVFILYHESAVDQIAVKHMKSLLSNPLIFLLTAIEIICLVPFTEEFLFRGLLQSWLKSKIKNVPLAILLTSFIFAVFHYTSAQGMTNIELLSSLFLLSCVLGFIYEKQHSLWAPIGMHALFNGISIVLIFKT